MVSIQTSAVTFFNALAMSMKPFLTIQARKFTFAVVWYLSAAETLSIFVHISKTVAPNYVTIC